MEKIVVDIDEIQLNPDNPRIIKDDKYKKLLKSIKEFPQMLELRPIVVNDDMVVLGGNMRLKACIEAGLKKVPIIRASSLTDEQQKEFIIKDNINFGEWDWDMLANEWDTELLNDWGLDVPSFENKDEDIFDEKEPDMSISWFINIRCQDESESQRLYDRFIAEGFDVKIIN